MDAHYDIVIVGTGFAGAFFLMRYLERAPANARVLVLERGASDSKAWQLAHRRTSSIAPQDVFVNLTPEKEWLTSPGPVSYDDLEEHYGEVERIMSVSGPADGPMPC